MRVKIKAGNPAGVTLNVVVEGATIADVAMRVGEAIKRDGMLYIVDEDGDAFIVGEEAISTGIISFNEAPAK